MQTYRVLGLSGAAFIHADSPEEAIETLRTLIRTGPTSLQKVSEHVFTHNNAIGMAVREIRRCLDDPYGLPKDLDSAGQRALLSALADRIEMRFTIESPQPATPVSSSTSSPASLPSGQSSAGSSPIEED